MVKHTFRKASLQLGRARGRIHGVAAVLAAFLFILLLFSVLRASLYREVGEERVWFEMTFLLLAAVIAELLIVYLRQPFVMILLIVGALISPSSIELLWPQISGASNMAFGAVSIPFSLPLTPPKLVVVDEIVSVFAQLGALILLLRIGIHSQVTQIFNLRNMAVALLGVIVPFICGYYFVSLSGGGFVYAMFMGAALTATSVGVTVAVLKEMGVMEREYSKVILGAAVIDDILALLVLSFIINVPAGLDAQSLMPLAITAGTAAVFIVGGIVIGREIMRREMISSTFERIGSENANWAFPLAMAFAFFYAYVAEYIGLSGIVGVFIAGVVLNYSKAARMLYDMMAPLEMLFTPIFFISLGMLIDVGSLASVAVPVVLLSGIAVASKVVGAGVAAGIFGMGKREAFVVGIGMVPRGEIALIIALFGLTTKTALGVPALSVVEYTTISTMAFVTTLVTPPALGALIHKAEAT